MHVLLCGNLTITNQAGREENANMRLLRGFERQHREVDILSRLSVSNLVALTKRSWSSVSSFCSPSCDLFRNSPHLFRVLLLRRLRLSLPPVLPLLFSVESAGARFREARARVSTNVRARSRSGRSKVHDAQRLEIVAESLPLFHHLCRIIQRIIPSPSMNCV